MTDVSPVMSDEFHNGTENGSVLERTPLSDPVSATHEQRPLRVKFLKPDGSKIQYADMIGRGMECVVYRYAEDKVLKIPRREATQAEDGTWSQPEKRYASRDSIILEQRAYERLYGVPGIAEYYGIESGGLVIRYYPKGCLEQLLSSADECTRHKWMIETTEIIHNCHEARVLLFDIAMRNFVVSDDTTLRAIDFEQADLLAYGTDMSKAQSNGLTVNIDLLHLGCVLYSLASATKFQVDCAFEEEWLNEFPSVEGIAAGQIIRGCWDRRYTSAKEVLGELRASLVTSPQPIAFAHDALSNVAASITALCSVQ
ncbi:hypothetical protein MBLNU457_g3002t1 [Dothideomycetes sp. NU457]